MPLLPYHADGILEFRIQSAAGVHHARIHTTKFGGDGVYDIPAAQAAGKLNVAGDLNVHDTAVAFLTAVQGHYGADASLSFFQALQRQNDGSYQPISVPAVASVAGSNPNGPVNTSDAANQLTFNMKDDQNNRTRVQLMGTRSFNIVPIITDGTTGPGAYMATVQFVTSVNHPVVSKHGRPIRPQARATFTFNRRLRRRAGLA